MTTKSLRPQPGQVDHTQRTEAGNGNQTSLTEVLRQEVAHGFLDAHARLHHNAGKVLEMASFCYALIELLEEKGILSYDELNDRQEVVCSRLVAKFADQGIGVMALQNYKEDKYGFKEQVELDCANRVHICRAACCRLDFALSKQDLKEDVLRWDLGEPYMIAKDADGYCRHIDRSTFQCTVWRHRPIPCRGYDCRTDERLWLDFEQGIINPDLEETLSQRDLEEPHG